MAHPLELDPVMLDLSATLEPKVRSDRNSEAVVEGLLSDLDGFPEALLAGLDEVVCHDSVRTSTPPSLGPFLYMLIEEYEDSDASPMSSMHLENFMFSRSAERSATPPALLLVSFQSSFYFCQNQTSDIIELLAEQ